MTEQGRDRYPAINRKSMIVACDVIASSTERQSEPGMDSCSKYYSPGRVISKIEKIHYFYGYSHRAGQSSGNPLQNSAIALIKKEL